MSTKNKTLIFSVLGLLVLGITSCSKDDSKPVDTGNNAKGLQLKENTAFGTILTDPDGKTLYFFALDANGSSGCTGDCEAAWPVYYNADASTDTGVDAADLGEITRADGSKQTTYKGWPLYYFANDTNTGDIKGDGVGKIWFVAKPDYSLMVVSNQLIGNDGKHYKTDLSEGDEATTYFTDGLGFTLYAFSPDKFNTNTFTTGDEAHDAVWPITEAGDLVLPSIIPSDLVGTIDVQGKKQLTFNGWPLYYFGQDAKRGDNKGVSVPRPGIWPVVNLNTTKAPEN